MKKKIDLGKDGKLSEEGQWEDGEGEEKKQKGEGAHEVEEMDVRRQGAGKREGARKKAYVDVELLVEAVVDDEVVRHAHPVRLHRVAAAIVVVTNFI